MIPDRKHIRLRNFDYTSEGWYFITICTKDRRCLFGNIENRTMNLTETGKQAFIFWNEIPQHFPTIELGEFIVMPNHIHGIIGIVRTRHGVSPQSQLNEFGKTIPGSLSAIIGQFKSTLTRWCNQNNHKEFAWQPRFHDHIIRNQIEYDRIENYIIENVTHWKTDRIYS